MVFCSMVMFPPTPKPLLSHFCFTPVSYLTSSPGITTVKKLTLVQSATIGFRAVLKEKPLKFHWSHKYWSRAWYQISNAMLSAADDHCVSCLNSCPLPSSLSHGFKLLRIHKILVIKTMSILFLFLTTLAFPSIVNNLSVTACVDSPFQEYGFLLDSLHFYLQAFTSILKLFLSTPCFLANHKPFFKKIKMVCFIVMQSIALLERMNS